MKVRELKKILESINPDWDVMIKCDEDSRDLITGFESHSIRDNMGWIQLTSCNYIGFGSQKESEQLCKIKRLLNENDFFWRD